MIVENGKIIEATRDELYHKWLSGDWDEFMPFEEYLYHMEQAGVKITEVKGYAETQTTMPA